MTIAPEYQHSFELFGTDIRLLVGDGGHPHAAHFLAAQVQERLRAIHHALTRFDPDSELSYLNTHAGEAVRASDTLLGAVIASLRTAQQSGGLVDPTVLTDLRSAGYGSSRARATPAPIREAIAAAPRRRPALPRADADWTRIHVNEPARLVRLPHGVSIDLGGTAKGWAVDLAADMLAGTPSYAVDAGGDIRIGGTARSPRVIEIEHPLDAADSRRVELAAGAIATSGLRTRLWRTPEGFGHHLIDPRRGRPAWTGVIQATALAPTALAAETLAKTAVLAGPHAGRRVLERYGGALVLDSGALDLVGNVSAFAGRPFDLAGTP